MVDLKQSRPPSDDAHREYMAFAADLGALYRLNARRLRIGDRTRTPSPEGVWMIDGGAPFDTALVTHWMPLPPPPASNSQE